ARFPLARSSSQGTHVARTTSLAILPFRNASADRSLDSLGSSVSEVLRTELGQLSGVRSVPADRLYAVLHDLRLAPNTALAPAELTRVADFTSVRIILSGQISTFGSAIRIDATLHDLELEQSVVLNTTAPNADSLLTAIAQLGERVRKALADG